jgi:hypothetical protein
MKIIRSSKRKLFKIAPFFLLVSLLPFLRSCGDLSYGFPLPAVYTKTFITVEKYFIGNLLINTFIALILSVLFLILIVRFIKYRSVLFAIRSVFLYHVLYLTGYFIIYPLSISLKLEILQYYYYLLYPFRFLFSDSFNVSNNYDIRLLYFASVLLWAAAGFLIAKFVKAKRT